VAERLHVRRPPRIQGYDKSEPLHLAAEATAPETLVAPRSFEAFYDAESRTLFRAGLR
jgi:hypothetical protein